MNLVILNYQVSEITFFEGQWVAKYNATNHSQPVRSGEFRVIKDVSYNSFIGSLIQHLREED